MNTKGFLTGGRRGKSINFDLNLRCMLACYWLGIGSKDMVKLISMLRFGSMPAFERYFTRNEKMLNRGIICVGKHIIQNSMVNEIIHSIKNKVDELYDIQSVENIINDFKNGDYDKLKTKIGTILLTVSYDIGW